MMAGNETQSGLDTHYESTIGWVIERTYNTFGPGMAELYQRRPYGVAEMSVDEVLRTHHRIKAEDAATTDSLFDEAAIRYNTFREELIYLPAVALEHAGVVYRALAKSAVLDDRILACHMIEHLTKYDAETGLDIWQGLLGDSSTQSEAFEMLIDPDNIRPELAQSLTLAQIAPLVRTYQEAKEWRH